MSQKDKVLAYLRTHNGITTFEAYSKLRITRLSSIIYLLKEDGHSFNEEWIIRKNGREDYKRYILKKVL